MKCLIKDRHAKITRCGCRYERLDFYDEDTTALVNLVTCYECLEAVLKHSHSQIVINRYVELERLAGEITVNPS